MKPHNATEYKDTCLHWLHVRLPSGVEEGSELAYIGRMGFGVCAACAGIRNACGLGGGRRWEHESGRQHKIIERSDTAGTANNRLDAPSTGGKKTSRILRTRQLGYSSRQHSYSITAQPI